MPLIEAALEQGHSTGSGATIALLRNVHVTREIADQHDAFPLSEGEVAMVVVGPEGERVQNVTVHDTLGGARRAFDQQSGGESPERRAGK